MWIRVRSARRADHTSGFDSQLSNQKDRAVRKCWATLKTHRRERREGGVGEPAPSFLFSKRVGWGWDVQAVSLEREGGREESELCGFEFVPLAERIRRPTPYLTALAAGRRGSEMHQPAESPMKSALVLARRVIPPFHTTVRPAVQPRRFWAAPTCGRRGSGLHGADSGLHGADSELHGATRRGLATLVGSPRRRLPVGGVASCTCCLSVGGSELHQPVVLKQA